ncbi:MAG: peptidoglycan DD-metalloendopeptidase family protein [Spirochaetes bacterium]|nr:peptidoglycan DD-metalloendopeptidase family protein [Spirochaetota bacterium]
MLPNNDMASLAGETRSRFKRAGTFFSRIPRKFLLVISAALALSLIAIIPNLTNGPEEPIDPILQDDIEKNKILQSSNTDYSNPDAKEKLVIVEHVVKPGENLSVIARDYGISIDTICGSNNLRSYDFIRAGTRLKIPNKDGILYRMRGGNNITGIAKKYRVSIEKIIAENDLKNPDFVQKDSVIFIPDAKPQNIIRGFMWPTRGRYITCGYGWRRNPFNRKYREFHQGLDIRARYEWIRASKYGKVTYTGWMGGYGNAVIIAHPGGWKTLYAHLSRIIVRRGQYVKQGQTIARSGNTGRSTGPHLHYEIIKSGRNKNPYTYLHKK